MTKSKPKFYPAEFKESAVKLAIESNMPMAQTAKELGVTRTTLYTWVDKYSKLKESMMRTDEHLYDELKRLKKDLARVTQERDLLKKAAAYFAKESQ
ncbi:MAG: transposase [Candidatus Megaira endosymbiont of Mesostigma viride]|nr:MAG: transposase [Candidatus Megaira endosymbiont of Mesostigma viride]HJK88449.1 transposase [Candidatus Megaira endosymbiont of Mesostigma viride]